MADDPTMQPIGLSTQPPSTVIPPAAPEVHHELAQALAAPSELRVAEVSSFVARHPRDLHGWAALTECVGEQMWKYSARASDTTVVLTRSSKWMARFWLRELG